MNDAGWQPAKQQISNLRYVGGASDSFLLSGLQACLLGRTAERPTHENCGPEHGRNSAARGLLIEGRTVAGEVLSARRLEACDTAGWKPALLLAARRWLK